MSDPMRFDSVAEARSTANGYAWVLDLARDDAADVISQWEDVDIDWSDVRAELDAHWDGMPPPEFSRLSLDPEYRDLVAREIGRIK